LFEAMAAHKVIVSTAVDGCREVLDGETAGLLVPPRDPPALGLALARVVDDAALRERLSRMAGEASRRYDIGECVRQMEALYDDVLRGPAPRSR
jgi:glycosyltransferase involved in cell wall biosynthesis